MPLALLKIKPCVLKFQIIVRYPEKNPLCVFASLRETQNAREQTRYVVSLSYA